MSKKTIKNVYIIGEARGAYRTQNFIKMLLDNQKEYKVHYNSFPTRNFIIRYFRSLFLSIFSIIQSDIVYVTTLNVDVNILFELLLAKLCFKKIIVEYYVSVYDTTVLDRKLFKDGSILSFVAKCIDRFFIKMGTIVTFLNETEKKRYTQLINVNSKQEKFRVLPLCAEEIGKINSKFLSGEKKELTACWWGSYLPLHGIENMLKAAKILEEKNFPVKFYFFGNSQEKGKIYRDYAKELNIKNYEFIDTYSFNNKKLLPFLQENCDLALGNFGDTDKAMNVLVNKVVDALTLKVNILTCNSNSALEFFNNDEDVFMCKADALEIASSIEKIYNTPKEELINRIENAYKVYENHFSIKVYLNDMKAILNEIS